MVCPTPIIPPILTISVKVSILQCEVFTWRSSLKLMTIPWMSSFRSNVNSLISYLKSLKRGFKSYLLPFYSVYSQEGEHLPVSILALQNFQVIPITSEVVLDFSLHQNSFFSVMYGGEQLNTFSDLLKYSVLRH